MTANNKLAASEVEKIIADASTKLNYYSMGKRVVGEQVFRLLEKNCRVLYYPLEEDDVWGFIERVKDQLFACINTSISFEKQIFAAAHELYHIWYDGQNVQEVVLSTNLEETKADPIDICELRANRFAAEFLVETSLLKQELKRSGASKNEVGIRDVLQLCNTFTVPYKTMARRLREIHVISADRLSELLSASEKEIQQQNTGYCSNSSAKQGYILLDNLVEKSIELYGKNLITHEKFEFLLGFAGVSPEDVGIVKSVYTPITDDEIAEILGGDDD